MDDLFFCSHGLSNAAQGSSEWAVLARPRSPRMGRSVGRSSRNGLVCVLWPSPGPLRSLSIG
eukprot:7707990-Pyramimonas_sp.AAC.1